MRLPSAERRPDCTAAARWWRKAAEQGDAGAQYELGKCYRYEYGVKENRREAVRWYRQAAEQGNSLAKAALKRMGVKWESVGKKRGAYSSISYSAMSSRKAGR